MKTVLSILFIIVLFPSFGQSHFIVNEGDIIWQKVYDTDLTFEEVTDYLIKSGIYEEYEVYGNSLMGDLKNFDADYKGAGYKEMVIPMYIPRYHYNGFCVLEYKENRYRVTLKKIQMIKIFDGPMGKEGETSNLSDYVLRNNGKMRGAFTKYTDIFEKTFDDMFTVSVDIEDNW